jgi:hypothetical protein
MSAIFLSVRPWRMLLHPLVPFSFLQLLLPRKKKNRRKYKRPRGQYEKRNDEAYALRNRMELMLRAAGPYSYLSYIINIF